MIRIWRSLGRTLKMESRRLTMELVLLPKKSSRNSMKYWERSPLTSTWKRTRKKRKTRTRPKRSKRMKLGL